MFRITAKYDDPWHPMQGDVVTVASVAEAMAAMADEPLADYCLGQLALGERCTCYGFGVEYTVERI